MTLVSARNDPFDRKAHRTFLLTRLLVFHTHMVFLCEMCLGQMSNTNPVPTVLLYEGGPLNVPN